MQQILCAVLLGSLCVSFASEPSFAEYVRAWGKPYTPGSREWSVHESIYNTAMESIHTHNTLYKLGHTLYKKGVNQFTDLSGDEKRRFLGYGGAHLAELSKHGTVHHAGALKNFRAASQLNWADEDVLTPVKNQGQCGSCWAFASTAVIESFLAIQTGSLVELSVQQLVDCAPNDEECGGYGGCEGSTAPLAFDYLIDAGGHTAHYAYPYKSYWGTEFTCMNDENPIAMKSVLAAKLEGYVRVANNSYDAMMEALSVGPVAINVDASVWHSYEGGIFDGCTYDSNVDINHVVQLVGYGTDSDANDYWLVRNSWGPSWGEEGFIRLKRYAPESTPCGWDYTPQDGTECTGGASKIYVCGTCGMFWDAAYPTVVTAP